MPLDDVTKAYFWDMKDACTDIMDFIHEKTFADFESQKVVRFAVERQLIVLGEAANHIPKHVQDHLNDIEWHAIISLRNILAHDYGDVLASRIWKIAIHNVPILREKLERILA